MAISFECRSCHKRFRAKNSARGKTMACGNCHETVTIEGPTVPDHDVFISHSSKDKMIADAVVAAMENRKIRCWVAPRDIPHGASWGEAIIEGIENSRIMVMIYSEHSNTSDHVLREIERAASKKVVILPFRLDESKMTKSMEFFLSACHWMDAMSPPLETHIEELVHSAVAFLRRLSPPLSDSSSHESSSPAFGPALGELFVPASQRAVVDKGTSDKPNYKVPELLRTLPVWGKWVLSGGLVGTALLLGMVLWFSFKTKPDGTVEGSGGFATTDPSPSVTSTTTQRDVVTVSKPDYDSIAKGTWLRLVDGSTPLPDPKGMTFRDGVLELTGCAFTFHEVNVRDVIIRANVRKVSGEALSIGVRNRPSDRNWPRYTGWFNGGNEFGIGKAGKNPWIELKSGHTGPVKDGFFEMWEQHVRRPHFQQVRGPHLERRTCGV